MWILLIALDCGCDHECLPGDGESFVCACNSGYFLHDDRKTCCNANPQIEDDKTCCKYKTPTT